MKQIQLANISALAAIIALSGTASVVHAQAPVTMAPPASTDPAAAPADQNVYNWQDVPKNQQIPITRAVFDQGGYQLYCSTGETIVVPFVNQNLYVMKFGQTNSGMYFVNDGSVAPTLYVPSGGYLENSAAQGARWYPFATNYTYTQPVYIGPAPSWNAYISMGWYPGMIYHGGYWGTRPYSGFGVRFSPMPGLSISISGSSYHSWGDYRTFYTANPTRRIVIRQAPVFARYNVPRHGPGPFGGRVASDSHHSFGDARPSGTFDGDHRGADGRFGGWGHGGGGDHGGDHGDRDRGGQDRGDRDRGDHGRP